MSLAFFALSVSLAAADGLTRLRVTSGELEYKPYSSSKVTASINAVVRNVGTVPASQIKVQATLPDGRSVDLKGPAALEVNKSETYSWEENTRALVKGKAQIEATCGNCRK